MLAEAKPVDGFGPQVDNEPVLVNPLHENVNREDEDVIERLRTRIRGLDDEIAKKLSEHDGSRPRQYYADDMPELNEAQSQRDNSWRSFIEVVKRVNAKHQQVDILDKPDQPQSGKQEKLLVAINALEAAECYRELNQHGEINLEDLRMCATIAKNIDIDELSANDQARLLYLRCVVALDRSRWEGDAKREAFLKSANESFQLLKASHPNSLLTTNAEHLLSDEQQNEKGGS